MLAEWWDHHLVLDATPDSLLHLDISRLDGDVVVEKSTYSAFLGTGLEATLRGMGVEEVIVTGVMTNLCCETTVVTTAVVVTTACTAGATGTTAGATSMAMGAMTIAKPAAFREPFECYHISDVEAGLGLRRKQMIAISLLVGNDHNLHGVPGFGVETAVRFDKLYSEDEIFDRLAEVSKGGILLLHGDIRSSKDLNILSSDENVATARLPHCSHCGHPGNKRDHSKLSCEYCIVVGSENCVKKSTGFKCICSTCDKVAQRFSQATIPCLS